MRCNMRRNAARAFSAAGASFVASPFFSPPPLPAERGAARASDAACITQMQTDWVTCVVAYPSNVQTVPCI